MSVLLLYLLDERKHRGRFARPLFRSASEPQGIITPKQSDTERMREFPPFMGESSQIPERGTEFRMCAGLVFSNFPGSIPVNRQFHYPPQFFQTLVLPREALCVPNEVELSY